MEKEIEKGGKLQNVHAGHRRRLRKKARSGIKNLEKHELIELLLTYTISRKNTNPLAHDLIRKYHEIANILDASFDDLKSVKGIGPETALFFKVIGETVKRYNESAKKKSKSFINSPADIVRYFRSHYDMKNCEEFVMLCINKNNQVIKASEIEGLDSKTVVFTARDVASNLIGDDIVGCAIIHTHPRGNCNPTMEDIDATRSILDTCIALNITLVDHVIINEDSHFSFRSQNILENLMGDYVKAHKYFGKSKAEFLIKQYSAL